MKSQLSHPIDSTWITTNGDSHTSNNNINNNNNHHTSNNNSYHSHRNRPTRLTSHLRHFSILLWKNWLLRRRAPFLLCAELLFPILFVCILTVFRGQAPIYPYPTCHVPVIAAPSAGLLRHVQSMVCNFNYTCHAFDPDVPPNRSSSELGNQSPFYRFARVLTRLLRHPSVHDLLKSWQTYTLWDTFYELFNVQSELNELYSTYYALPSLMLQGQPEETRLIDRMNVSAMKQASELFCATPHNDLQRLLDFFDSSRRNHSMNASGIVDELDVAAAATAVVVSDTAYNLNETNDKGNHSNAIPARIQIRHMRICPLLSAFFSWEPVLQVAGRLRFFLFGQVAYYPSTPLTDQIVVEANQVHALLQAIRTEIKVYFNETRLLLHTYMQEQMTSLHDHGYICDQLSLFVSDEAGSMCQQVIQWSDPKRSKNLSESHWTNTLHTVELAVAAIESILDCMNLDSRFVPFNTQTSFDSFISANASDPPHSPIGLQFELNPSNESDARLEQLMGMVLRVNPFLSDTTFRFKVLDRYWSPHPRRAPDTDMKYFTSGFIDLQDTLSQAWLRLVSQDHHHHHLQTTTNDKSVGIEFKLFPVGPYSEDLFLYLFAAHLPQLMILAWSLTVVASVKYLVDERENGLSSMLTVLGVSEELSRFAWFSVSLTLVSISIIPMIILLQCTGIVAKANCLVLFLFMFTYGVAILTYSLLCSLFFTRANLAAVVCGGLYYVGYLPAPLLLHYETFISPTLILIVSCLLPQVSHTFGWAHLLRMELDPRGTQWSELWYSGYHVGPYPLGLSLVLLWCSILVQLLLVFWIVPRMKLLLRAIMARFRIKVLHRNGGSFSRSNTPHSTQLTPVHEMNGVKQLTAESRVDSALSLLHDPPTTTITTLSNGHGEFARLPRQLC